MAVAKKKKEGGFEGETMEEGWQYKFTCADSVACSLANKKLLLAFNLAGKRSATSRCHCWTASFIRTTTSINE